MTPHLDHEPRSQRNLIFAPGAATAEILTFIPPLHSSVSPPLTERRQASTLTGNLQVLTLPAESTASTKMLTSPATSGTQSQEASGPSWRMVPHLDQPPCSQTNL